MEPQVEPGTGNSTRLVLRTTLAKGSTRDNSPTFCPVMRSHERKFTHNTVQHIKQAPVAVSVPGTK